MTLKHKGEFEIESGLGLPRLTTAERLAYTPPETGYQVFDTDLGVVATWNSTEWVLFDLDTKIDVVDGVGVNSLSLGDAVDNPILSISVGPVGEDFVVPGPSTETIPVTGLDYGTLTSIIRSTNISDRDVVLLSENNQRIGFNPNATDEHTFRYIIRGDETLHKTGGIWYWETVVLGPDGTPASHGSSSDRGHALGFSRSTGILGPTGTRFSNATPNSMIGYTISGNGWNLTSVGVRRTTIDSEGLDGFTSPNFTLRHLLNLETGEYFTAGNDSDFTLIVDEIDVSFAYTPLVGLLNLDTSGLDGVRLNIAADEIEYDVPTGALLLNQVVSESSEVTSVSVPDEITNISTTDSFLSVGIESSTALAFNDDGIFASSVVYGSDGEATNSFVTKGYFDDRLSESFTRNFLVSDWVVGAAGVDSQLVISSSDHGLDFTANATNYTIEVFQLNGELLQTVSIQTATNQTTGDVVLLTTGAPFDGRVVIE